MCAASSPTQSEDALISLRWLEAARESIEPSEGDKLMVGIDVAGSDGGDETYAVIRQGTQIVAMEGWTLRDPLTEVNKFLYPFKNRIVEVNIDTIGVGLNFKPRLEALGYPCNGVNVGESSDDTDIYSGLKAQLYWKLRELFEEGKIHGLTDELAISQLSSIRWRSNLHGKIVIESKDEMKKRGVKSPDRAEAIMWLLPTVALASASSTKRRLKIEPRAKGIRVCRSPRRILRSKTNTIARKILRLRYGDDYWERSNKLPSRQVRNPHSVFVGIANCQFAARRRKSDRRDGTRSASGSDYGPTYWRVGGEAPGPAVGQALQFCSECSRSSQSVK